MILLKIYVGTATDNGSGRDGEKKRRGSSR
jgi:hypothetical protein